MESVFRWVSFTQLGVEPGCEGNTFKEILTRLSPEWNTFKYIQEKPDYIIFRVEAWSTPEGLESCGAEGQINENNPQVRYQIKDQRLRKGNAL